MPPFRPFAVDPRSTSRAVRRYRSGVRPLEDRVTLSASPGSPFDSDDLAALLAGTDVSDEPSAPLAISSSSIPDILANESAQDAAVLPSGTLDPTFDADGIRTISSPLGSSEFARDVARQSDGKYVTVGYSEAGPAIPRASYVARYNADGTLDTTFGDGGKVYVPGSSNVYRLHSVEITAAGKILVAGEHSWGVLLARLNADGSFDPSFGADGKTTWEIPNGNSLNSNYWPSTALDADGKIVVVRYYRDSTTSSSLRFSVIRFHADGSLDTGFNGTGYLVFDANPLGDEVPLDVAVQADGKIVIVGRTQASASNVDFFAARITSAGVLDSTFGTGGRVNINVGGSSTSSDTAYRVAIQADGKIVLAGVANNDFGVVRLNTDGSLDASFTGTGKVVTNFGNTEVAYALVLQSDGKIVVGGYTSSNNGEFALARYDTNGSLDNSFDGDGKAVPGLLTAGERIFGLVVDPDGKLVAAGVGLDPMSDNDFAIARLTAAGALDTSFAASGAALLNFGPGPAVAYHVIPLPDGKLLVAGVAGENGAASTGRHAVWRLLADGSLDPTFGTGGVSLGTLPGWITAGFARQSDGKLLVLDRVSNRVIRLTADGAVDTSFGTGGVFTLGSIFSEESSLAVQADDRILIGGRRFNSSSSADEFMVACLFSNGTGFDTSFSGDGQTQIDVGVGHDRINTVVVQADGKILLGGTANNGSNDDIALVRINADGSLDTSFSGDGRIVEGPVTGIDRIRSILVQPDGRIVVGGAAGGDFAVYRYLADGTPDTSFAGDGTFSLNVGAIDDVYALMVQADGALLAVGQSSLGVAAVFRITPSGTLDTSLDGADGVLLYDAGVSSSLFTPVGALQADGKLVVVATTLQQFRYDVLALRYLTAPTPVDLPPAVAGVYVRGSAWTASYLDHLDAGGWGAAGTPGLGYALAGGSSQLSTTIPWSNVDRITIRFDSDVTASLGSLTLYGSSGQGVAATGIRQIDGRTFEWTVPTLGPDKYLIHLGAATIEGTNGQGSTGLVLDGEWTTESTSWTEGSGDGAAGGDFNFRFNVLPGDFDSSGSITFGEIGQARLKLGLTTASVGYVYRQDYDGSGSITFGEIGQARGRLGQTIAGFADPPTPPDSLAGSIVGDAFAGESIADPSESISESSQPVADAVELWSIQLTETSATLSELVALSHFIEPAPVVERETISYGASPLDFGATVQAAKFDLPAARFGRLAQSVAASVGFRSSVFRGVRMQTWTTVRNDLRPAVRSFDLGDEGAAVATTRFGRPESDEAPRGWHRLRRRSEASADTGLLADAPSSADVGSEIRGRDSRPLFSS